MHLAHNFAELPKLPSPIALTIGFFDGVHLGHQALFSRLKTLGRPVCLTFENHPLTVLRPDALRPLLTSNPHRYSLIEACGIEALLALPFTREFANQDPETFLTHLRQHLPFDHLLLGHDTHLGKDRAGTPQNLKSLAQTMGFALDQLDTFEVSGSPVSSSRIRHAIESGDLSLARELLGRPITYRDTVIRGRGVGNQIGTHTANLPLDGLCLPPDGVYAARLNGLPAVANLGTAPTLQTGRRRLLEVHLLDQSADLYDQQVEVSLYSYLRPEKKFPSAEALRKQISEDIAAVRKAYN